MADKVNINRDIDTMPHPISIFPYASWGSLDNILDVNNPSGPPLTPHEVSSLTHQLCVALCYLHNEAGVIHADIAARNILVMSRPLDGSHDIAIKLADFGSALRYAELLGGESERPGRMKSDVEHVGMVLGKCVEHLSRQGGMDIDWARDGMSVSICKGLGGLRDMIEMNAGWTMSGRTKGWLTAAQVEVMARMICDFAGLISS